MVRGDLVRHRNKEEGRMKPKNIINVKHDYKQIVNAIKKGMSIKFNKKIQSIKNPYGDGKSAERIIKIIKKIDLTNFNTQKKLTY